MSAHNVNIFSFETIIKSSLKLRAFEAQQLKFREVKVRLLVHWCVYHGVA